MSIHLRHSEVESGQRWDSAAKSPGENKIKMHEFIHNNAPAGFTYISIIRHCVVTLELEFELNLLSLGCYVAQGGILTVDCNLNLALIRRSHSVVGDAFVVLGLLPFNLCDVEELPLAHQPI